MGRRRPRFLPEGQAGYVDILYVIRVSEAFSDAGITPALNDSGFALTCNECGTEQGLDEMVLSDAAGLTIYACSKCGQSLVGVKPFKTDAEAREMSGFRLKGNVIGSKVDIFMKPPGASGTLALNATPGFFA